ncbi:DUF4145 domain-containing protein [Microcoleus sp. Pol11C3]|uniref:DUF4145 domain-containing protein n=1 Tax=Microcoleus sp. Pol11C3 TaxID=3055390 RepID=UPI002FCECB8C
MRLPPSILNKYLARFDELIQEGERIYKVLKDMSIAFLWGTEEVIRALTQQELEYRHKLPGWYLNYLSLLDRIIPPRSVHRKLLDGTERYFEDFEKLNTHVYQLSLSIKKMKDDFKGNLKNLGLGELGAAIAADYMGQAEQLNTHIYRLKGLKDDFKKGFLGDLGLEIEAEIVADYMGQAEHLLAEGQSGKYDHVPAAVLAGAVLEKSLRTLCDKQSPSIPTVNDKGKPLTLTPLIEALKKNKVFNEVTAKQLRGWADIRNSAAHGNFDEFNRSQVDLMIQGINNFLATHMI